MGNPFALHLILLTTQRLNLSPAPFVTFGLFPEMSEALQNETCNVLVSGSYKIYGDSKLQDKIFSGSYIMSSFHISRDPLVSVIRPGDYAWFDLVEVSIYDLVQRVFKSNRILARTVPRYTITRDLTYSSSLAFGNGNFTNQSGCKGGGTAILSQKY